MSPFFDWVAVALLAGLLIGCFVGFREAERRWWMRLVMAFFALCLTIVTPLLIWGITNGDSLEIPSENGYGILVAAVILWAGVVAYARRPLDPIQAETEKGKWGCFRTLFAMIGCVVVGYAMIVLLVFGLGALIGLAGYLTG